MTNQSEFPNAMSADRFERMFPNDEACAEDLFRRRWPDGFVCPDCGSRNAVCLKRKRCVRRCRDCRKQTSVTAGTFMHRSHVPLRSWHRALHIMISHSNGMSALQLQSRPGLGSYKSAWTLAHKIRRAMDATDGFPLIADVQADETSIPYRLKGSEPPPGGRGHECRLMIAEAVGVFGENSPGCAELRRIMDQSGPTLKAFLKDAADPGTWIAADGWAGCDGLENHTAVAVGDTPAHEVLEWIHRVFSNLKRWGLGVLHGFRRKHLDWQLAEWSFRWNWRRQRGESLFALLGPGANPPRTASLHLNSHFVAGVPPDRILRIRAGSRAKRQDSDRIFEPKARFRRESTCCGCGLKAISHFTEFGHVIVARQPPSARFSRIELIIS